MVSVVQLQAQQRQLRQVSRGLSLQQQQAQIRSGLSQQQFIRREEQKIRQEVQSRINRELKSQGRSIDDILKNVNSIEQFNELITQVPPELRQFIKTNETALRADLQNRIKQVNDRISLRQTQITNLNIAKDEALQDNDRAKADRLDSERRGLEKERDFLKGEGLGRFNAGQLIPVSSIFSVARDIGLNEEEKRRALDRQFSELSQKLEGGRDELRRIIRTQEITQQQAIRLGLVEAQAPTQEISPIQEISPPPREISDFEKLVSPTEQTAFERLTGFTPKKRFVDLQKIPIEFKDVFQTSNGISDIKEKSFIGKLKQITFGLPEILKEKPIELDLVSKIEKAPRGAILLSKITDPFRGLFPKEGLKEIGEGLGQLAEVTIELPIKLAKEIGRVGEVKKIEEKFIEISPELFAPTISQEFEIPSGTILDIGKLPIFEVPVISKEVKKERLDFLRSEKFTFGGNIETLRNAEQEDLISRTKLKVEGETNRLLPSLERELKNTKDKLQKDLNERKITAEEANKELTDKTEQLNKTFQGKIEKVVTDFTKKEGEKINDRLTKLSKVQGLKQAIVLAPITIATGIALVGVGGIATTGLKILFGTVAAFQIPALTQIIKDRDLLTITTLGITVAGFAIGGAIGGKIRGKFIESTKIRPAIDRAQVETIVKARNLEVIKKFKFPKEFELEVKTLIDKGFSIRVIETKLKAVRVADSKLLPDVRGRFIEILTRDGRIIETISIGDVIAITPRKTFSRDIISESVGKVIGEKSLISTRTIVGKLKGDKFKALEELVTLQETQITGRERLTRTEEQIRAETTTFLVEKLTKRQIKKQKIFKPDEFGGVFRTKKDLIGGNILEATKLTKQQLDLFLKQQKKAGKRISETEAVSIEKVTGLDITRDIRIKELGFGVKQELGEILTGFKTGKSKIQSFTVNIPEIKIKKIPKKVPRKTLQEVFGAGTEVKKFQFKDFFKTKGGKDIIQQQKQINKNIDELVKTGVPEIITKEVAREIVKVEVRPKLVFGKIEPFGDVGKIDDLGVLSGRLGGGLLTGLETKGELKEKERARGRGRVDLGLLTGLASGLETKQERKQRLKTGLLFPDITKVISDFSQVQKPLTGFAQIQPQAQLQSQLQQLETNLMGIEISPIPITTPITPKIPTTIPFVFGIPKKKKLIRLPKLDMGFDVFVKSKGKQIKVTKNPVIESSAKDIGSFLVDNTLSAEFSLKKSSKQPKQPKIQVPKNYWELNKNKFRQFRIKKGQPIPLKNTFIELKPQRLDTFGEIRKITTARLISQRRAKKTNIDKISKNLNKIFGF